MINGTYERPLDNKKGLRLQRLLIGARGETRAANHLDSG